MPYVVGPKGQIVIAKEIRDKRGVQPGWLAVQQLVDGHVEVYFLPPEQNRSLKGSLARYTTVRIPTEEALDRGEDLTDFDPGPTYSGGLPRRHRDLGSKHQCPPRKMD